MGETWLLPKRVFDGEHLRENVAIKIIDGIVDSLHPTSATSSNAQKLDGIISPGFIDLQVNGGGGILFNDTPTVEGILAIANAHSAFGTIGILPTIITDAPEVMDKAVEAAIAARECSGILGVHIEGPHISVPRRGTHAECHVRPMDNATISQVERLRNNGVAVMITLAPEAATSDQISHLARLGAVVSIGHSDATAEATTQAIEAGASCATHLFNAMSPMLNRAPGVTGAVINSTIAAGIIVDGIHVADKMIAIAMRARPVEDTLFLVSDAMPTVGGPDKFKLYGVDVYLKDGCLVNDEGSLAGAHLTQAEGVYRLANTVGIEH
ncbi:MAG: N-acetylglucosamine-6-phosphate deacetylase, partial [Paracoccaceae bacterium]|nr:N-acetylglucosamine-6-phosphate deacetylase [Paracoccaceae bacterium]